MNPDFFLISALIDFVLLNVLFSTMALGLERATRRRFHDRRTGHLRARFLFWLAMAPFALSLLIIGGLQVPAQLLYEPHEPTEYVTLRIFSVALIGLIGLAVTSTRQVASWMLTHRFHQQVLQSSQPVHSRRLPTVLPVFRIKHSLPLCCILGLRRPKLFLADQLFEVLDEAEMRGALAHEEAHWRHHDNWKYFGLSVIKNFFFFLPTYRRLVEVWRDAAEFACDEEAAGRTQAPLDLASALIKIAKLTPTQTPSPAVLLAGLGLTDFTSSARLEQRVTRLLALAEEQPPVASPWRPSLFSCVTGAAALVALGVLLTEHNLFYSVHRLIEIFEQFLM